ncbi:hypothetical protein AKO1_002516 [Acrasis kona]|uniref:DET1- and DDB1-associated protein 1 domain-containing protein n=1 Tax=Acrasis kona TaxID=1008807 RepID=A0AAW2ZPS8_9EUKA
MSDLPVFVKGNFSKVGPVRSQKRLPLYICLHNKHAPHQPVQHIETERDSILHRYFQNLERQQQTQQQQIMQQNMINPPINNPTLFSPSSSLGKRSIATAFENDDVIEVDPILKPQKIRRTNNNNPSTSTSDFY